MRHTIRGVIGLVACVAFATAAMAMGSLPGGSTADNCDNADGALGDAAFVIATKPDRRRPRRERLRGHGLLPHLREHR